MIVIRKSKHGIRVAKAFHCVKDEWRQIRHTDIVHVSYSTCPPENGILLNVNKTFSSTISLDADVDTIQAAYTKTVRNEINRASKECIEVIEHDPEQLRMDKKTIQSLANMYHEFCKADKYSNIDAYLDINELYKLAEVGALYATTVECCNERIMHLYSYDSRSAMLLFSYNTVKSEEREIRNAIGRANKYLHHYDICMFKKMGVHIYDWGGLFDPENPNGIDKFKLSFGSVPRDAYDFYYGSSVIGKMALYLMKHRRSGKKNAT